MAAVADQGFIAQRQRDFAQLRPLEIRPPDRNHLQFAESAAGRTERM
jgi:hypothetical protein